MALSQSEKTILISALQFKKEALMKDLNDIQLLIEKTEGGVIGDNIVIEDESRRRRRRSPLTKEFYFEKIKQVLLLNEEDEKFLTSREILQELYKEFEDEFDEKEDRKHIATVSAVLYSKVAEKVIESQKDERQQTRFKLIEDISYLADKFDKEVAEKQKRAVPSSIDGLPF